MFLESDTFCFLVPTVLVKITHKQGMFGAAQHSTVCLWRVSVCLWRVSVCSEGDEKEIMTFYDYPASRQCIYPIIPRGPLGHSGCHGSLGSPCWKGLQS